MMPSIEATLTMFLAALEHVTADDLAQVEGGHQVDVDDPAELLERLVLGRDRVRDAGIVDQ